MNWHSVWSELRDNLQRLPKCEMHPEFPCVKTLAHEWENDIIAIAESGITVRSHHSRSGGMREDPIDSTRFERWWDNFIANGHASLKARDSKSGGRSSVIGAIFAAALPKYVKVIDKSLVKLRSFPADTKPSAVSDTTPSASTAQSIEVVIPVSPELPAVQPLIAPNSDERKLVANELDFDPLTEEDARKRVLREIVQRGGQHRFREQLLVAYRNRCAVTGCSLVPVLEAAHIQRYLGEHTNTVKNGLLLRADIHTLFDLNLLGINPDDLTVSVAASVHGTSYVKLDGQPLRVLPRDDSMKPSTESLRIRWEEYWAASGEC